MDAVIITVKHQYYIELGLSGIAGICQNGLPVILDVKGIFNPAEATERGFIYWRL
jgi:UDP-N-acetyl-D-glucosamine/UDP-N-acetyl-D-galactosamine dehydrogenase